MPRIQDIYNRTGKQVTAKEVGIATIKGGALGGAMRKMGGMGQMIMDALKKRKKLPKFPTAPERRPEPPMTKPMPKRFPMPKPTMTPLKGAKELQDLKKQKRWAY